MKALIEINTPVQHISGWDTEIVDEVTTINHKIIENIPNSARICQIEESEFEVCPEVLLWVECNASVTTQDYYYDTSDSTIKPIVNAEEPTE
jgi:hypothetical protein